MVIAFSNNCQQRQPVRLRREQREISVQTHRLLRSHRNPARPTKKTRPNNIRDESFSLAEIFSLEVEATGFCTVFL
jgi:hypothetical protein